MDIETIQTDVSEAESAQAVAAQELAPDANLDSGMEQERLESPSSDPVTRREDKMAAAHEARKEEQAHQRREYWLMNNPEQTGDDYDAMLNREQVDASGQQEERPAAVAQEQTAVAQTTQPANGWKTVDGVRYKTLMVNGEPKRISEEQYDRLVQKDLAGDDKLRRASQQEQELQRKSNELAERERRLQERVAPKVDTGQILRTKIKEHSELLLEGDVDAANEKMVEILTLGRESSTPNLDELTAQVATRVIPQVERKAAQTALDNNVNDGWQHLLANYPDVVGNEDALTFADIQIKKVKAANPDWTPKQVMIEAATLTREKLKLTAPATPGAGTVVTADLTAQRRERKANIKPLPNASSKRHEKKAPAPVDMSPEAKIARMRGGRAL